MMTRELRSLTGIRGVAACLVALFHMYPSGHGLSLADPVVRHAYIMVDLFFVLSGFVMAMMYGRLPSDVSPGASYWSFLTRRIARIYPLHAVVLILCIAATSLLATGSGPPSTWDVSANALLVQSWGMARSINPPSWSISAEWAAYLAFPILAHVCLRRGPIVAACAATVAVAALGSLTLLPGALTHPFGPAGPLNVWSPATPAPVVRCLAEFALGMIVWRAGRAEGARWVPVRAGCARPCAASS